MAYLGKYRPAYVDWFRERESILLDMGFASYRDYINSPIWKTIRQSVIEKQSKCCLCGADGVVVHHKQYDKKTLSGKSTKHLKLLCVLCHDLVHTDDEGKPATWRTVHFKFWIKEREYELVQKYQRDGVKLAC